MSGAPVLRQAPSVAQALRQARQLLAESQTISAELVLRQLVQQHADCVEAWMLLADLAEQRGDNERARECVQQATARAPNSESLALGIAQRQIESDQYADAVETLAGALERQPQSFLSWIMLGDVFDLAGMHDLAVSARFQGVRRGQAAGKLMSMATTPPVLQPVIQQLIAEVNQQQERRIGEALERMRALVGADELKRVAHAMAAYLGQVQDAPANRHQKPKFLFFPGLPEGPYHDPYLHPWAKRLDDAYDDIRAEALAVLRQEEGLENFLSFKPGQSKAGYLGGAGRNPSWDAFFFFRHGVRNDANHQRCPKTSALLDSIELCAVAGQAPEICLSVLQPGTHIMPHYGVTNTRLVMHLPLLVPADCALNVLGGGEHAWKEGQLMMFDDTYQHEAWNKSDQTRVILLMDCWNPHLSSAERVAARHLIEVISDYENRAEGDLHLIAQGMRQQATA